MGKPARPKFTESPTVREHELLEGTNLRSETGLGIGCAPITALKWHVPVEHSSDNVGYRVLQISTHQTVIPTCGTLLVKDLGGNEIM